MRIDAYNQISNFYNTNTKKTSQKSTVSTGTRDQVSFSTVAKDMQTAKAAAASTPDVRADKVADIKARLAAGTYQVSGEAFADKILSSL